MIIGARVLLVLLPIAKLVHGPRPGFVCRPHPGRYRAGGYAASVRQHERPRAVDKFGRARHRRALTVALLHFCGLTAEGLGPNGEATHLRTPWHVKDAGSKVCRSPHSSAGFRCMSALPMIVQQERAAIMIVQQERVLRLVVCLYR